MTVHGLSETLFVQINSIVVILVNAIQICHLFRKGNKKTSHEMLIFSLALSDFLVGILTFAFKLGFILSLSKIINLLRQEVIDLNTYATIPILFSISSSLFHIFGITMDRYIAVRYPFQQKVWITRSRTRLFTIISWLLSLTAASIPVLVVLCHVGNTSLAEKRVKIIFFASGLSVNCLLLSSYLPIVRRAVYGTGYDGKRRNRGTDEADISKKEKRLIGVCFAIVLCFFVCMVPFSIEVFLPDDESVYSCMLLLSNSMLNPLIYFYGRYIEKTKKVMNGVQKSKREGEKVGESTDISMSSITVNSNFLCHK